MSGPISVELLRQILDYDPETGALTWRERPVSMFADTGCGGAKGNAARWNGKNAGKPALSTVMTNGYRHGPVFNQWQYAHRVAWAIYHGERPAETIDHIDHDRANNRIDNLRAVTRAENSRNMSPAKDRSRSGVCGVYWDKANAKWRAIIRAEGRKICLGRFASLDAAASARRAAERLHGYHPNHGKAVCQ